MKQKYLVCSVGVQSLLSQKSCGRKRKKCLQLLCPVLVCLRVKGCCSGSWGWLQPGVEGRRAVDQVAAVISVVESTGVDWLEKTGRLTCFGASLPSTLWVSQGLKKVFANEQQRNFDEAATKEQSEVSWWCNMYAVSPGVVSAWYRLQHLSCENGEVPVSSS